jgi:hypothetical protein
LQLQDAGATVEEAKDYVDQLQEQLQRGGTMQQPEGNPPERDESSNVPGRVIDAVAWAQLMQRVSGCDSERDVGFPPSSVSLGDLAKIFEATRPQPPAIPASVLAEAPHLQEYLRTTRTDEHLERTWRLRQTYATEKATDAIIDLMQRHSMPDPIPRSIWRDIILDKFVDFERLYAGMDRGYDHDDEPKDFASGYSIIKKDHFRAKKSVSTEAEWTRVARTWKRAVDLLYPHREAELETYMGIIEELFRAAPRSPSVAILVDFEARDRYAKHPYRMDDRNQLHPSILTQMFKAAPSSSLGKRPTFSSPSVNKKPGSVCRNWNLGFCNDSECPYQRTHGVCCECGGTHQAKDREDCLGKLKRRRRTTTQ